MIEAAQSSEGSLKGDIEFWRQLLQYLPEVQLESIDQYCRLKGCIQHLAENVKELDFSGTLSYLEERYEKPYLELAEKKQ